MIRLLRQAEVASAAKFPEAMSFTEAVTKFVQQALPNNPIQAWIQIGGVFATIHWSVEFSDLSDYEEGLMKLMIDQEYQGMLTAASDCWLPGSVTDTLLRSL